MELKTFRSEEEFVNNSASLIADEIWNAQQAKGRAQIALCGGSTVGKTFQLLGEMALEDQIDLLKTDVYITDDRYVPLNDPRSNYKLIKDGLYQGKNEQFLANFYHFDTSLSIHQAVEKYKKDICSIPNLSLDLTVLGIGEDGHFGSIYPGYLEMDKAELAFHSETEIFDVKDRLTMGPLILTNSKIILVMLKGEKKKAVLEELLNGNKNPQEYPAMILLNHLNLIIFYCE